LKDKPRNRRSNTTVKDSFNEIVKARRLNFRGKFNGYAGPVEISPIGLAVLANDAQMVLGLIKGDISCAVQVQSTNTKYFRATALQLACSLGLPEIANVLLRNKASADGVLPLTVNGITTESWDTPLTILVSTVEHHIKPQLEDVKLPNLPEPDFVACMNLILEFTLPKIRSYVSGKPPIHSVLTNQAPHIQPSDHTMLDMYLSVCRDKGCLLDAVDATDNQGMTALEYLADQRETGFRLDVMEKLLRAGASLNGKFDPIKVATTRQNHNMVELMNRYLS
jgi:hypothetical protein